MAKKNEHEKSPHANPNAHPYKAKRFGSRGSSLLAYHPERRARYPLGIGIPVSAILNRGDTEERKHGINNSAPPPFHVSVMQT